MTRLTSELISGMSDHLAAYDLELVRKTGLTLRQIAARTAGISEEDFCFAFSSARVAVIPITAGQGVIKGFTRAVEGIIAYLGCPCFITENSDAAGMAESIEKDATIFFLADDYRYIAVDLIHKRVIDNAETTGWSYAYALDACAGGLKGRDVLLIGAGRVGKNAIAALEKLEAKVGVFDIDAQKTRSLSSKFSIHEEEDLAAALDRYTLFYDASPIADIIQVKHIKPETAIAACGIPLGVSDEARPLVEDRLIHDPLQLGTAAMLAMAVRHGSINKNGGRIGRIA